MATVYWQAVPTATVPVPLPAGALTVHSHLSAQESFLVLTPLSADNAMVPVSGYPRIQPNAKNPNWEVYFSAERGRLYIHKAASPPGTQNMTLILFGAGVSVWEMEQAVNVTTRQPVASENPLSYLGSAHGQPFRPYGPIFAATKP